jgi:hypothetical protein
MGGELVESGKRTAAGARASRAAGPLPVRMSVV